MDDLTRYIYFNYMNLMSADEYAAHMAYVLREKNAHVKYPVPEEIMRAEWPHWIPPSPSVEALLSGGVSAFQVSVRERILHECSDEVFINRCPLCGTLARTPQARQCPKCFHSWRGSV